MGLPKEAMLFQNICSDASRVQVENSSQNEKINALCPNAAYLNS